MREHDLFEFFACFGEQQLVFGVGEGCEEIPRPFAGFPGKRFTACLQDEPVAALPAGPGCPVYVRQQIVWNVKSSRWHD